MDNLEELQVALSDITGHDGENDNLVPTGQRQCPICHRAMRVEMQGGIGVDVCPAHGLWLDNGESRGAFFGLRALIFD